MVPGRRTRAYIRRGTLRYGENVTYIWHEMEAKTGSCEMNHDDLTSFLQGIHDHLREGVLRKNCPRPILGGVEFLFARNPNQKDFCKLNMGISHPLFLISMRIANNYVGS